MAERDEFDPTGVIAESYRITSIGAPECRSVFLDWVLSLRPPATPATAIPVLLARHGTVGHPMTETLRAGLIAAAPPQRRGGARARAR